jgi:hypothetical protein
VRLRKEGLVRRVAGTTPPVAPPRGKESKYPRAITRGLAVGAVAVMSVVAFSPAAGATSPESGTFNFTDAFTDPDVCASSGFVVSVVQHEYGFYNVFFNRAGDFVEAIVHQNYDATISANGKTIRERDTWNIFFYPDGSREAGLTVHIQGPGGIVQLDAGQIVRDANGDVVYTHGPHPQLNGESFCPALAP